MEDKNKTLESSTPVEPGNSQEQEPLSPISPQNQGTKRKTVVIAIVALIIVLLISGLLFYYQQKPQSPDVQEQAQQAVVLPCNEVSDHQDRNDCYYNMAIKQANPENCANITSKTNREGCYIVIAENTGQKSICENIEDRKKKLFCYSLVNKEVPPEPVKIIEITSPSSGQVFQQGSNITISWRGGRKFVRAGVIPLEGPKKGIIHWIVNDSSPDNSITWDGNRACRIPVGLSTCVDISPGEYIVYVDSVNNPKTDYVEMIVNGQSVSDALHTIILR
jgi:hypothetical protein